ncbi:predicted protein [Uncinocarpus reesii 1704]|uniref:F-box domain-containing protein n=1 Tax=Uncinocarpus reesii (strain UAMH 1704) TaxID=336963 RepID=C4JNN9_UNCRE|nr:uncharacterized protein UREG_03037 [Uncinocarpus reesii 1704]EEP78192.1 predicted protein [Uncinocarpus reesii 1704]
MHTQYMDAGCIRGQEEASYQDLLPQLPLCSLKWEEAPYNFSQARQEANNAKTRIMKWWSLKALLASSTLISRLFGKPEKRRNAMNLPNSPVEIILQISNYLTYASRFALTLTCKEIYFKTTDPNQLVPSARLTTIMPNTKAYDIEDLLEIERWPVYTTFDHGLRELNCFACHLCLKIRSAGQFSNAMMKGKRGKFGGLSADRFCIDCGVYYKRYARGTTMRFGGVCGGVGSVCQRCGRFRAHIGVAQNTQKCMCSSGFDFETMYSDPFEISEDCGDWRDILM